MSKLRKGLPKPEKVRQAEVKKGLGVRQAQIQNNGNVRPYAKTNKK